MKVLVPQGGRTEPGGLAGPYPAAVLGGTERVSDEGTISHWRWQSYGCSGYSIRRMQLHEALPVARVIQEDRSTHRIGASFDRGDGQSTQRRSLLAVREKSSQKTLSPQTVIILRKWRAFPATNLVAREYS